MTKINANDARTHLIELLEHAEHGEESTIAIKGDPLARIRPVLGTHDVEAARAAIRQIREYAKSHPIPNLTAEEIKSWIEEGRP